MPVINDTLILTRYHTNAASVKSHSVLSVVSYPNNDGGLNAYITDGIITIILNTAISIIISLLLLFNNIATQVTIVNIISHDQLK